jgi:hypothetical protein
LKLLAVIDSKTGDHKGRRQHVPHMKHEPCKRCDVGDTRFDECVPGIEKEEFEGEGRVYFDTLTHELVVKSEGVEFARRASTSPTGMQEAWAIAEWLARRPRFSRVGRGLILGMRVKEIESVRAAIKVLDHDEQIGKMSKGKMKKNGMGRAKRMKGEEKAA